MVALPYLTKDDYNQLGFTKLAKINDDAFNQLEINAANLFDVLTGNYYGRNSITDDPDKVRVTLFRKALALQMEFMNDNRLAAPYDKAQFYGFVGKGGYRVHHYTTPGTSRRWDLRLKGDQQRMANVKQAFIKGLVGNGFRSTTSRSN